MKGDEPEPEVCDHYDAHVGLILFELEDMEEQFPCSWCGDVASLGILKELRHRIAFCDECRRVIGILVGAGDDK